MLAASHAHAFRTVGPRALRPVTEPAPAPDCIDVPASRWPERHKRELMFAALPRERYRVGFEPGCGVGANTGSLAERCERLIAADADLAAVKVAQARTDPDAPVRFEHWEVPDAWPDEALDLIVIADFACHLSPARLERLWERCLQSLAPGGHLLMCHWRSPLGDSWIGGEELHERALAALSMVPVSRYSDDHLRIDVWQAATPVGNA